MLQRILEKQFEKDAKKAIKRGKNIKKLGEVIDLLVKGQPLDKKYCNHKLQGVFKDHWECHISPDWLLIYRKTTTKLILVRTGSHSDLF